MSRKHTRTSALNLSTAAKLSLIGLSILITSACTTTGNIEGSTTPNKRKPNSSLNQAHSNDIWQRIRNNFAMPDLVNSEVTNKELYYANKADYVNRMTNRSGDFLYLIMNEVERRQMPSELALLPFIESAFVTTAQSPVKASGLWQFMPATGRDFSLAQNRFADQRNDVIASTNAALSYLQRLYNQFGDWHLALAAYNWGEGNVARAIKRAAASGRATGYEDIKMPAETRQYVPKLQAIKNIVNNPDNYGIQLPSIDNRPRHETISVTRDIDINTAAELAHMSLEEFTRINPSFKQPLIIAALGTKVLVPTQYADDFKAALSDRSRQLASLTSYTTFTSESLEDIAGKYQTSADQLRSLNNIPYSHGIVQSGSTLIVPRLNHHDDIPYTALNSNLKTSPTGFSYPSAPNFNDSTLENLAQAPTVLIDEDGNIRSQIPTQNTDQAGLTALLSRPTPIPVSSLPKVIQSTSAPDNSTSALDNFIANNKTNNKTNNTNTAPVQSLTDAPILAAVDSKLFDSATTQAPQTAQTQPPVDITNRPKVIVATNEAKDSLSELINNPPPATDVTPIQRTQIADKDAPNEDTINSNSLPKDIITSDPNRVQVLPTPTTPPALARTPTLRIDENGTVLSEHNHTQNLAIPGLTVPDLNAPTLANPPLADTGIRVNAQARTDNTQREQTRNILKTSTAAKPTAPARVNLANQTKSTGKANSQTKALKATGKEQTNASKAKITNNKPVATKTSPTAKINGGKTQKDTALAQSKTKASAPSAKKSTPSPAPTTKVTKSAAKPNKATKPTNPTSATAKASTKATAKPVDKKSNGKATPATKKK